MKKVLVLMLVLGMASFANAAFSLKVQVGGSDVTEVNPGDVVKLILGETSSSAGGCDSLVMNVSQAGSGSSGSMGTWMLAPFALGVEAADPERDHLSRGARFVGWRQPLAQPPDDHRQQEPGDGNDGDACGGGTKGGPGIVPDLFSQRADLLRGGRQPRPEEVNRFGEPLGQFQVHPNAPRGRLCCRVT